MGDVDSKVTGVMNVVTLADNRCNVRICASQRLNSYIFSLAEHFCSYFATLVNTFNHKLAGRRFFSLELRFFNWLITLFEKKNSFACI